VAARGELIVASTYFLQGRNVSGSRVSGGLSCDILTTWIMSKRDFIHWVTGREIASRLTGT
jgi:hypothetical protein